MIRYVSGNILDADAEALVNPVNCVGVMGAGLALRFRERFPANYRAYRRACHAGEMVPGRVFVTDLGRALEYMEHEPRWIVNFPTKVGWRVSSRLEWIADGLPDLADFCRREGVRSVALPRLGCGLGGLSWSDVRPLIEAAFAGLPDVDVQVFGPGPGETDREGAAHAEP